MNSDFKELLAALNEEHVDYLVVGGYAVIYHSRPRFTKDLDPYLGKDDLIRAKTIAGRPEDLADIRNLRMLDEGPNEL